MNYNRYDIFWVELDFVRGSELSKRDRMVIISLDAEPVLETVVICPLTSRLRPQWRTRLQVKAANKWTSPPTKFGWSAGAVSEKSARSRMTPLPSATAHGNGNG